jgi:hypothetical protein
MQTFDHKNFNPEMEMPHELDVKRKVMAQNLSPELLSKNCAEYLYESGQYKNNRMRVCDVFNERRDEEKRLK